MRIQLGLLIAAILALPLSANAQSDFSAEDIVNHFKPEKKTRQVTFGATGFGNAASSAATGTATTGSASTGAASTTGAATPAAEAPAAYNLMVTFELNSDQLTDRAQRNLAEFAKALKAPELLSLRFAVDGHTDASGPEQYNHNLSERRALAVVSYLTALGVDRSRLTPKGYGETRPIKSDGRHPENRRVETRVIR